jgi:hypothetical protein
MFSWALLCSGAPGCWVLRWLLSCPDVPVPFLRGSPALFFLWVEAEVQVHLDGCRCHFCCWSRKAEAQTLAAVGDAHDKAGPAEPAGGQCG